MRELLSEEGMIVLLVFSSSISVSEHEAAKQIRCDKKRPCSACKATSTTCQSAPRRPKEHKQRVLISTQ